MKLYTRPVGPIGTNCYIVEEEGSCAVIDPGAQSARLGAFLEANGLSPSHILLTHGHYDHIGAVKALREKFGCKLVIGRGDAELLSDLEKSLGCMGMEPPETYLMTPDLLVGEGDTVKAGELAFEVFETPGHTKGGVSYRCGDALFTGDTMFAGNIGRTDFYGGSYREIIASLKKLAALPGDYRVLPGHGPESTLSWERELNPYMRATGYETLY